MHTESKIIAAKVVSYVENICIIFFLNIKHYEDFNFSKCRFVRRSITLLSVQACCNYWKNIFYYLCFSPMINLMVYEEDDGAISSIKVLANTNLHEK